MNYKAATQALDRAALLAFVAHTELRMSTRQISRRGAIRQTVELMRSQPLQIEDKRITRYLKLMNHEPSNADTNSEV